MPFLNSEGEPSQEDTQTNFCDSWVVEQMMIHIDPSVDLTFIPKVVLELPEAHRAAAKRAIVRAAIDGLIELRPDGGLGRFSQAQLDAAPMCIQSVLPGAHWLWARVLHAEQSGSVSK